MGKSNTCRHVMGDGHALCRQDHWRENQSLR
jgi:hypothetical protein